MNFLVEHLQTLSIFFRFNFVIGTILYMCIYIYILLFSFQLLIYFLTNCVES